MFTPSCSYSRNLSAIFHRLLLTPNQVLRRTLFVCVLTAMAAAGAQAQTTAARYDAATGMQTSHMVLSSRKTTLVMNGEVLGHTQIPLGEKFTIINENASGFVQKNGQVSLGCSVKITDKKGRVLLQMADLFAAKEVFSIAESKFLKCTVSTGKPMTWDQKYEVTAVFWDKWGKGKITNRLTIETIDLP